MCMVHGTDLLGNVGTIPSVSVLARDIEVRSQEDGLTFIALTWKLSRDGNTHLDSPMLLMIG